MRIIRKAKVRNSPVTEMVQKKSQESGERAARSGMGAREAAERAKRDGETEQSPPGQERHQKRTRTEQVKRTDELTTTGSGNK